MRKLAILLTSAVLAFSAVGCQSWGTSGCCSKKCGKCCCKCGKRGKNNCNNNCCRRGR